MDICTGGNLFKHLMQQHRFSERVAKFIIQELLLGFEYLHERDIVFRDIKPENILVDIDGHIRIADFGLAKVIPRNERSYSFCGSKEYLSPEMFKTRAGHDRRLDIYCLGVLLYEMLTGLPPFFNDDSDVMWENILNTEPVLDQPYLSREVKDLIRRLLKKEPEHRLQTMTEIKSHVWFRGTNWNQVASKALKPPLVPDINMSYFEVDDADSDQDESVLQFSPQSANRDSPRQRYNLRRQSYYLHSTMYCMDEQNSSQIRTPNILRQLID